MKEPFAKLKTRENFQKFHIRESKKALKWFFGSSQKLSLAKILMIKVDSVSPL